MWVVLECDCYSLEDTFGMYTVRNVFGVFESEEAAKEFVHNQPESYATEFEIRELRPKA